VCKVITFMVTFGVQNVSDVLNREQKSKNPNDSCVVVITKKPFPTQTACSTLLTCLLAAFTSTFESMYVLVLLCSLSLHSH